MPDTLHLRETTAATLSEAAVNQNGQALLRIIAPGWSENGRYYSEDLLKRDGLRAFREGVHTYLNHPSQTEQIDRPERDVRDLVGSLTENAFYDPSGPVGPGLYARATVRQDYQPIVDDLAEAIGMSIRAEGTGHQGEAEGRQGLIIDTIESAQSVDYVTQPAAGGRVVQLLESVQNPQREEIAEAEPPESGRQELREARNAADWIEVEIHRGIFGLVNYMWEHGYLTRDEWSAVNDATGAAMETFRSSLTTAIPDLLTRDPLVRPDPAPTSMSEANAGTPPAPAPTDPPADGAGQTADPSAPTDVTESTSEEGAMTDNPGAGTAPTPLSTFRQQISNELEHERSRAALAEARERARAILSARLAEEAISPAAAHRITESVLLNLPLTDQRQLDEAALLTRIAEHVDQSILEATEVLSAAGLGRPRDLGFQESMAGGVFVGGEQHTAQIKERFISLGLSESAAETAAKGRA